MANDTSARAKLDREFAGGLEDAVVHNLVDRIVIGTIVAALGRQGLLPREVITALRKMDVGDGADPQSATISRILNERIDELEALF